MANFEGGFLETRDSQVFDLGQTPSTRQGNTLRCFTLKQLVKGVENMKESMTDSVTIDGAPVSEICVIGEVVSSELNVAFVSYEIKDCSETFRIKKFLKNTGGAATVEEEPIKNHTWVNVYGVLRVMGTDSYLATFDIEQIEDFNQISYHFARCIREHLYYTKGPLTPPAEPAPLAATPAKSGRPETGSVAKAPRLMPPMSENVEDAIQQLFANGNEVSIDEMYELLSEDYSKKEIRSAVERMASSGLIYAGSSEDSYLWCG